ncbi:MAG: hypothetical protein LBH58_05325 [Tannerellaceae bacterium]|jgi:hypothetical protein|nr:hypothetical protein [Tannerellaceae bacterium]
MRKWVLLIVFTSIKLLMMAQMNGVGYTPRQLTEEEKKVILHKGTLPYCHGYTKRF